jgi:hypothetical protein
LAGYLHVQAIQYDQTCWCAGCSVDYCRFKINQSEPAQRTVFTPCINK